MPRLAEVDNLEHYDPAGEPPEQIREDLRTALGWAAAIGDGLGPAPRPKDDVRRALKTVVRAALDAGTLKAFRVSAMAPGAVELFREAASQAGVPVEMLESVGTPDAAPGAPPRLLGIQEGESGTGVVHTIESGMTAATARHTHDFGWRPVRLTPARLQTLGELAPGPWGRLNEGGPVPPSVQSSLTRLAEAVRFSSTARALAAILTPVAIATSFTIARHGEKACCTWNSEAPGNQFTTNPFRESEGRRPVVTIEPDHTASPRDFRQILSLGERKPALREVAGGFERVTLREAFRWTAGPQGDWNRAFELSGRTLSGRWLLEAVEIGDRRVWSFSRAG